MSKARENASDHVLIGVTFASYWLRGWYEFTVPIIERSKEIPVQSWILSKAIKNISNIQSLFFFFMDRGKSEQNEASINPSFLEKRFENKQKILY